MAASAMVLAACGGPVVAGPVGTEQGPLGSDPQEVPVVNMEYIDMPELVVDIPAITYDLQKELAPPVEARFFYLVRPELAQTPTLPTPACPACLR
jgi:hypothetical protein